MFSSSVNPEPYLIDLSKEQLLLPLVFSVVLLISDFAFIISSFLFSVQFTFPLLILQVGVWHRFESFLFS